MVHNDLNLNDTLINEFKKILLKEFAEAATNSIFKNSQGDIIVFVSYKIIPTGRNYRVFAGATDVGIFSTTKTALCWCVADKFKDFNTAREIHELDTKILGLSNDISTRATVADKSKVPQFRETISTKLESKIIKKKALEKQLENRIKWTKYLQQRGFNNETERSGPKGNAKTNR
jgi:hypothetical protein